MLLIFYDVCCQPWFLSVKRLNVVQVALHLLLKLHLECQITISGVVWKVLVLHNCFGHWWILNLSAGRKPFGACGFVPSSLKREKCGGFPRIASHAILGEYFGMSHPVESEGHREAFLDLPAAALFRVDAASHEKMISKQILYSSLHMCSMIYGQFWFVWCVYDDMICFFSRSDCHGQRWTFDHWRLVL